MILRVYNQNGKVKITKTMGYREITIYSDLPEGEVAEIEIGVTQYTKTNRKKLGTEKGGSQK